MFVGVRGASSWLNWGLLSLALSLVGCRSFSNLPTHFEGRMLKREASVITETPVRIDITSDGEKNFVISAHDINALEVFRLNAVRISMAGLRLDGSESFLQNLKLGAKQSSEGCFVGESKQVTIQFCYTQARLFLEALDERQFPVLSLSGLSFPSVGPFALEPPVTLTLDEAIRQTLRRNFDSRIEYERLIQAAYTAKAAYQNLLPHLNLTVILANLMPTAISLALSVGELAPFLLPNRWLQAHEARLQAYAEGDALVLMRADLALQVEGLAYGLQRDIDTLKLYRNLRDRTQTIYDAVKPLEEKKKAPDGSSDHLKAMINSMTLDISAMELVLKQDRSALAQALGYLSPEAVANVTFNLDFPPTQEGTPAVDYKSYLVPALERSFELRQLRTLVEVAKLQKKELYYNWLDPSGDYRADLGFELKSLVVVARSRIREAELRHEQMKTVIAKKVFDAVSTYNQTIEAYPTAVESLSLHERRLDRLIEQIEEGSTNFNTLDIDTVLTDYLASGTRAQALIANFRTARARLNRLLFRGYYGNISELVTRPPASSLDAPPESSHSLSLH